MFEFSFSGLKSAVINTVHLEQKGETSAADVAAAFQQAVVEILVEKTRLAAAEKGKTVLLAGGVAANSLLRDRLEQVLREDGRKLFYPPPDLCTDNAAMVAAAGWDLFREGKFAGLDLNAVPVLDIFRQGE